MMKFGKSKFVRGLAIGATLLSSAYFSGCGKDNGITNPTPEPEPQGDYVLEGNAHELEGYEIQSFNPESGEVVLDGGQNLREGDVLISGISESTPNGLLRKIESIEGNTAQTSRATLNDAVEECEINLQNIRLTPADQALAGKSGFSFNIEDVNQVVYDADANLNTTDDQIVLSGNLSFDFDIRNLDLVANNSGLQEFAFDTYTTQDMGLGVNSKVPANLSGNFPVHAPIPCAPIPLGPFIVVPYVHLNVNVDGDFSVSETNISQSSSLDAGVSYIEGDWDTHSELDNNFEFTTPSLSNNMEAKVSFGPKVSFLLYNTAGVSTGINAYSRIEVDNETNPWWKLFAGIETTMGVDLTVMGWPIAGRTFPLANLEELIAEAEELPPEELIARLTVNPNSGIEPLDVLLDASESSPQELINEYHFVFGDGNTYTETSENAPDGNFDGKTTHTYQAGNFIPRVTVKDSLGREASEVSDIVVEEELVNFGKIAFCVGSQAENDVDIYLINPDGSGLINLTTSPNADERYPEWSNDGSRIAFTYFDRTNDGEQIYTMDADGSNWVHLAPGSYPFWSPNGDKVVFMHSGKIYTMNADGSGSIDFITDGRYPSWSPSGNKILFNHHDGTQWDIYKINTDGSDIQNVTNTPGSNEVCAVYSPDEQSMAFHSDLDGGSAVYVTDANGSNWKKIAAGYQPSWSPDGAKVTFMASGNIYVADKDGSNLEQLTTGLEEASSPAWGLR